MRVTNAMMVATSKININGNKTNIDKVNRQMSNQKKIVKPSDDPIIAIRALRMRSTLSTIDQYYERNIPDTESWMEITETAMNNMKDILTKAYEQTVYGATDELNQENRQTILKDLKALQEQIYNEGNADFEGRTVFTGYKTDRQLTFTSAEDASNASYEITERFDYQDIDRFKYYTGTFKDTTSATLTGSKPSLVGEHNIKRIRLAYDKIEDNTATALDPKLNISYPDGKDNISFGLGGSSISFMGVDFAAVPPSTGNDAVINPTPATPTDVKLYKNSDTQYTVCKANSKNPPDPADIYGMVTLKGSATNPTWSLSIGGGTGGTPGPSITFETSNTEELQKNNYAGLEGNTDYKIVLDTTSGELLLTDGMADYIESKRADVSLTYSKTGFDVGELRPENYFDCVNKTDPDHRLVYKNYDENGEWISEGIYYNIANKQEMKINTEARDVFDTGIRRDMDELIDIVQRAIDAQDAVTEIKSKLNSGEYQEGTDEYQKLSDWLDAANKQLDYANQNMHDTYSRYITKFQGYLGKVTLAITDSGSRGERVELTKNRMNNQQTVFEELKSVNEDADLSELVIDYSAAQVSYQAALQSAAKIGKMTLLDFI